MMERMIIGIGTDLAEVDRIAESMSRFGDRFLNRIYTERERRYALRNRNPAERFAARFAAKEAGMKAIGTGWRRGVTWQDFEVVNEPGGRPMLRLSGVAAKVATHLGMVRVSLSLTHTARIAMAVVILEGGEPKVMP
jgi:holo-[acyl-carrier protein] synthase